MNCYLGFDSSTQGIKAVLIDTDTGWVSEPLSVRYGQMRTKWEAPNGFLFHEDSAIRHAPPGMWLDGLEELLSKMQSAGWPMQEIRGISGSAQQHGSVYVNNLFPQALSSLDCATSLSGQLACALSRPTAPIWMDASTTLQCGQLTERFGEELRLATGAPATLRFTGPQIMKFAQEDPDGWEKTIQVHLVSSFMASVLAGKPAPIDFGDGAGMNLLNLNTLSWDKAITDFTADGLAVKLPPCRPSSTRYGNLSPYFEKYGLRSGIPLIIWSGDNPCSFIGCGGALKNAAVISLGTSDTLSRSVSTFSEGLENEGALFGNPAGGLFSLLCFSNGSLAREHIRSRYGLSWDSFNELCGRNRDYGKHLMLPYFCPESIPVVNTPGVHADFDWEAAAPAIVIRALLESQALTMRLHAGAKWHPAQIHLTGGASANALIRQTIADVFQIPVVIHSFTEMAALGAAIRAAQAVGNHPWDDLSRQFCADAEIVQPRGELAGIYIQALERYSALERSSR